MVVIFASFECKECVQEIWFAYELKRYSKGEAQFEETTKGNYWHPLGHHERHRELAFLTEVLVTVVLQLT